jgi:trafficking protein particle complex subunit 5
MTNRFVSTPPELSSVTCAAYVAGIINGVLDSAKFTCRVTAHNVTDEERGGGADKTVFLIKFSEDVMTREARMG